MIQSDIQLPIAYIERDADWGEYMLQGREIVWIFESGLKTWKLIHPDCFAYVSSVK
jgi:hypothetical protein